MSQLPPASAGEAAPGGWGSLCVQVPLPEVRRGGPCSGHSNLGASRCGGYSAFPQRHGVPGAEFPAAPSRPPGAFFSGPQTFSEFSRHPPLWASLQEELRFSFILDTRAWDQPRVPRGRFKTLCVMENFKWALQSRTHSDRWAVPNAQDPGGTDPQHPLPLTLLGSC